MEKNSTHKHLDGKPADYDFCGICGSLGEIAKTDGNLKKVCRKCAGLEPVKGQPIQHWKEQKKVHRNDPCPCGSEKKYKKCCASNQTKDFIR